MISFVTHNMATGTSETQRRKTRLDTTMPGAACHTMRNTGGIFRNAFNRACHFGLGGCSEFGLSGLIQVSFAASLQNFSLAHHGRRPQFPTDSLRVRLCDGPSAALGTTSR